jgi:hypothetical protein
MNKFEVFQYLLSQNKTKDYFRLTQKKQHSKSK